MYPAMGQTITVDGMSCEHCEETVKDALESVAGVTAASADREASTANIEGSAATDDLLAAVDDAGYDASA
jgi:copper chaperone CopZ